MFGGPPVSTRCDALVPCTTLFASVGFPGSGAACCVVDWWRVGKPKLLGQPARAVEQTFGLLCHVCFLEVIDELRRLLALRLPHRFEDAGLGDAAEIIVDRRPPSGFHYVEPDGLRETVGLDEPALDAMDGNARPAIAITLPLARVE